MTVWYNTVLKNKIIKDREPKFISWLTSCDFPETQLHSSMLSSIQFFVTPWTVAHQVPLSMEFSRQEHWNKLPFPNPEAQFLISKKGSISSFSVAKIKVRYRLISQKNKRKNK